MTSPSKDAERVSAFIDARPNEEVLAGLLGGSPWLFVRSGADFDKWRAEVAGEIGLPGKALFVVGSAAVGFSLNPARAGRPFREDTDEDPSDVDLALVSEALFEEAWNASVKGERARTHRLAKVHREGFYWGHADQRKLPMSSGPGRKVVSLAAGASRRTPVRGHPVTVRLYRRAEDLWHYQLYGLRSIRTRLAGVDGSS